MRYLARRIGTGEWIDRDLPLRDVERTRNLDGPGLITATIDPELRTAVHTDGQRILDEWGTQVFAEDDTGVLRNCGIFVDATYQNSTLTANCPGFATYPQGYLYDQARNWGPVSSGQTRGGQIVPAIDRPDPLAIVVDHWDWIQAQPDSNLGVRVVGSRTSGVVIGSYEEPYRLRWWEVPDLGREIDDLAASTPFNYVEEVQWGDPAHQAVDLRVRLGWPRLGRSREDLRFALGENVVETVEAATSGSDFANDLLGVGAGEGSRMVRARASKSDGRLRRTRILTDKTATQGRMDRLTSRFIARTSETLNVSEVKIVDHPNAPVSALEPGDDVYVECYVPAYGGDVALWLRIIGITENDTGATTTLRTTRSDGFIYNPTVEVSG